jgi:hypothetical protein
MGPLSPLFAEFWLKTTLFNENCENNEIAYTTGLFDDLT